MKNKLISFLLVFMMLVLPIHANTPCKLILNGIAYTPNYTPIVAEETLFLALDDLVDMTYSSYTQDENGTYTWPLQGIPLVFSPNSRVVKTHIKNEFTAKAPRLFNEILYVPVSILDFANYPYTLTSDLKQFELTALLPYSSSTDTYGSHTTVSTHYHTLSEIFEPLSEDSTLLVQSALKYNQYLSFASNAYKKDVLAGIKTLSKDLPTLEVTFRNLDLLDTTPTSSHLTTYPLTVTAENNGLRLKFNDTNMIYECLWPTYNPNKKDTTIDIHKSLDVMIMRALYENYRDTYDLKDDVHFSPITTVQMGRSDAITYTVYSDHLLDQTHTYTVTIYKYITQKKISYIVDLGAHNVEPNSTVSTK